ncbi:MAG: RagB/SusD family nutrient uptake outer membrane protein [Odoribacteraceae bacterium]|jgi:hypothetical protein|nr:RagB/SusD family nutrient uptake outer membrane protein [Odoribacteraceae bacterium]
MKYIHTLLLPVLLLMASCDLLDIQPVNRMVPVSVADYESVLLGGYPRAEFFMRTELATDNVYANLNATNAPAAINEPWFVWASTHLLPDAEDAYWNQLYSSIYYANSVLDQFAGMTPEPEEKALFETVRGEARALRAYCYFYLVNLYADTYEEANLDKPGVPMPLSAEDVHQHTQNNARVPVGEVWEQIDKDLEAAARDLSGKPSKSLYRFDYISLQALRARVYLFTRRYDEAIAAASDVIAARPLFNMNDMQEYIDDQGERYAFAGNTGFIDRGYKDEVLFFVGGRANTNIYYYSTYTFKPDPALLDLCYRAEADSARDYRRYIFDSFAASPTDRVAQGPTVYHMFATQEKYCYYIGFKVSEAYVTRAEALARRNTGQDRDNALRDINALLAARHKASLYAPLAAADLPGDQLLARVLEERRLELAFDGGLRWFDLRRLGKPAITHAYKDGNTYSLAQGDPRYVLQIPFSEQENSPNMPLNPR